MAQARRGTLVRWGLMALLAVMTLLAGYQWRRAEVAQLTQKEAERSTQAAKGGPEPGPARPLESYDSLGNVSLQLGDLKAAREYFKKYLNLSEQLARQDPDSTRGAAISRSLMTGWATSVCSWETRRGPGNTLKNLLT